MVGVQNAEIKNSIFNNSKGIQMHLVVGGPIAKVHHNNFFDSEKVIVTGDQDYEVNTLWSLDPKFLNKTSYSLQEDSELQNKGDDGLHLGLIK